MFLSSGLYRWYRDLTDSAFRLADSLFKQITASEEFHLALKQIQLNLL